MTDYSYNFFANKSTQSLAQDTYYHTFYQVSQENPNTMITYTYDNSKNLIETFDVSFGPFSVSEALQILDQSGANPYVVGTNSTGTEFRSMDIGYFDIYNRLLTTSQHKGVMTKVNKTDLLIPAPEWILLFRQKSVWGASDPKNGLNTSNPAADNYSILNNMTGTNYVNEEDNKYHFKYMDVTNSAEVEWKQSSNFTTTSESVTYNAPEFELISTSVTNISSFSGLAISSHNTQTYYDGMKDASWWWALGAKQTHTNDSSTGFPTFDKDGFVSNHIELWVYSFPL